MAATVKIYVWRIHRRLITILDVPVDMRDAVMAALPESDRLRMEQYINTDETSDESTDTSTDDSSTKA